MVKRAYFGRPRRDRPATIKKGGETYKYNSTTDTYVNHNTNDVLTWLIVSGMMDSGSAAPAYDSGCSNYDSGYSGSSSSYDSGSSSCDSGSSGGGDSGGGSSGGCD